MSNAIEHISDTALLVAAARAAETKLEDGLVRDPYAARLAGERGIAIVRSGSPSRWRSFGIGLRSRFIDEFLLSELRDETIDCVLCLGAGLDARPWRLPLSSNLRWIESDFAPILDYKYGILSDVAPACRLERITADLNAQADRQRVLETALGHSSRVLLLTEGLLFYLPGETVHSLALETASCHRWVLDISPQTSLLLAMGGDSMRQANQFRHETRLEGAEVLELLGNSGWTAAASKTFMRDGAPFAVQRMATNGWTPDPNSPRLSPDDPAGVWLFQRAG
jgi:methyltransferase (TIGR00027 family)